MSEPGDARILGGPWRLVFVEGKFLRGVPLALHSVKKSETKIHVALPMNIIFETSGKLTAVA
jgi:hypothetical protein